MKNLISFYKKHLSWRPSYYKKSWKAYKYLENYEEYLQNKHNDYQFRGGVNFSFNEKESATHVFSEIFIGECYPINKGTKQEKVIIDIGANIGEFSVSMRINFPESAIFSIEPCKPEYNCLLENSQEYDLFPFMIGISDKDEVLKLVDRNSSGDSVFLRKNINLNISDNEKTYDVNCINLNSFCHQNDIYHIDLLKVEAEGQEPEVLSGIDFSNIFIDYITVDVGPERGNEKLDTHNSVREILEKSNFSQIKFNNKRKIALFKNQNK